MAFNALFQITILILWESIAKAVTSPLEAIKRFRLQKQHAQKTTNVINDPIDTIFVNQDQQKIFKKRDQGMSANYGDIEDGTSYE